MKKPANKIKHAPSFDVGAFISSTSTGRNAVVRRLRRNRDRAAILAKGGDQGEGK